MKVNINDIKLIPDSQRFAKAEQVYSFRYQKHLQRLAMSNILINGRTNVTQTDIDRVKELEQYLKLP